MVDGYFFFTISRLTTVYPIEILSKRSVRYHTGQPYEWMIKIVLFNLILHDCWTNLLLRIRVPRLQSVEEQKFKFVMFVFFAY